MTGDCYLDLVQVFYHNLKVVDGVICSWVKGAHIKIDDEIWLSFTRLKAEGFMSHERNSELNQRTNKKKIYKEYLRSPTRLKWGSPKATVALSNGSDGIPHCSPTIMVEFSYGSGDAPTAAMALSNGSGGALQRHSTRNSIVEKSLIMIHKKLDEDNALITPSASQCDDEDDTTKDESMETSDSD
ncbi:hypothetical protein LR48_Vigan125s000300 [Vigna angularis]|uniref:Uncharacterized protein n=1 Tax=Phaseolus angularis TaxID=3914 RepID=A0A0L9T4W0_PHAAN|nr:hypothetical protein LR48_Vigan125s000300 [Vigna angularis]